MLKVIALTGPKGSGKDTIGKILQQIYPSEDIRTIAFADPIKHVVQHIFHLNTDNNDQYDLFKRSDVSCQLSESFNHQVTGRHIVREIGMMMRGYKERQFTDYVMQNIRYSPTAVWVVTDLRFDNEYSIMKNIGAKIIKIIRPSYEYEGHITERGFDDHLVDKIIMNDGELEYLKTRVKNIVDPILQEWNSL